jgi:hypothetical protein
VRGLRARQVVTVGGHSIILGVSEHVDSAGPGWARLGAARQGSARQDEGILL